MAQPIAWKRLIAEGAAIVVSILLAFAIDAGWDARQERARERELLGIVLEELGENRALLDTSLEELETLVDQIRFVLESSPQTLSSMSPDSIGTLAVPFGSLPEYEPQVSQIDAIVSSGEIRLISNPTVRRNLSRWQTALGDLADQGDVVTNAYYYLNEVISEHEVVAAGFAGPFGQARPLDFDDLSMPVALASARADPRFRDRATQLWGTWQGYMRMAEAAGDVLDELTRTLEAEAVR